jgi:hypothetical protein
VGAIKHEQAGEILLLECEVLGRVSNCSIAVFFYNEMNLLWAHKIQRENVLILVRDAALFMIKTPKAFQSLCLNTRNVTCLTQALHRVAEEVREWYSEVEKLPSFLA